MDHKTLSLAPHEDTHRVDRLLDAHRAGFSLAQPFYTDPDVFHAELKAIWQREWLFAGLTCELPKPGSWFKLDVANASVVVTRDQTGTIRAFHNTCRHRGSRLCTATSGTSRNFTCPYHQWTYAGSGELIFARDMGPDFDKSQFSLHPVHVRELAGYLFVSLADHPPSFDEFADCVAPYLLPHRFADARVVAESTLVERANWKLVIENNRECYHCRAGHPELLRTIADIEDTNDPKCSPAFREKALRDEARWAQQGLPYRLATHPQGWQVVRVPMARGQSFTTSGQPASKRLMGELPDFDVGSARLLHFPNTWNHALGDHAIAFRVTPIGPQTTEVTTKWLVHKDAVEGVDYSLDDLTAVWKATNDQDRTLAENNQLGINTPGYQPGPYSPEFEVGVLAFIDWYLRAMRG
jgi:Rieske 2Fe-2S family protein